MIVLIGALIVSFVPSFALYFLFKQWKEEKEYKSLCKKTLVKGLLCVFPVVALSALFSLCSLLLKSDRIPLFIKTFYYTFIVLSFSEELAKWLSLKSFLKKNPYSFHDILAFGTIIGLFFGISEDFLYAFNTNAVQIIVRGLCAGHGVYAFIASYYYAKALKEKKKGYAIFGFVLSWLLHGAYDFGLNSEMYERYEMVGMISLLIAIFEFIMVIYIFIFVIKAKKKEELNEPLLIVSQESKEDHFLEKGDSAD